MELRRDSPESYYNKWSTRVMLSLKLLMKKIRFRILLDRNLNRELLVYRQNYPDRSAFIVDVMLS